MKTLVCITGSSFCEIGLVLINEISKYHHVYAVISKSAVTVLKKEKNIEFNQSKFKNVTFYNNDDISSAPASGSFGIEKTIVAPCSINTLAKISNGISDSLITRACAVALKEQKKLILGVREMPFSAISLEQMSRLANIGVIIAPPIMAGYSCAKNLKEMSNFVVGKWLDLLGFENDLYKRWS